MWPEGNDWAWPDRVGHMDDRARGEFIAETFNKAYRA